MIASATMRMTPPRMMIIAGWMSVTTRRTAAGISRP
jgi:hypothetical protein